MINERALAAMWNGLLRGELVDIYNIRYAKYIKIHAVARETVK